MKILFICHGNICRSPMAEFYFRDLVARHHAAPYFEIASCATSSEEIWRGVGNPVYPPARAELAKHGIACEGKRAVQLQRSDYARYDLLIAMDTSNLRGIYRIIGSDPQNKVHRLLDYTPTGGDVADPWYTDRFDIAYADIARGCDALWEALCRENPSWKNLFDITEYI